MTGWELVGLFGGFAAALVALFIFVFNKVSDRSEWRGKVDSDRVTFTKFIEEVRGDLKEIRADIKKIFQSLPPATATTQSPLRLTELGEAISKEIQAKEWAALLAEQLADKAVGKSAYEIQDMAREYCKDELMLDDQKNAACQQAAFDHGVNLEQVKGVLGIELRDVLLKKAGLEPSG